MQMRRFNEMPNGPTEPRSSSWSVIHHQLISPEWSRTLITSLPSNGKHRTFQLYFLTLAVKLQPRRKLALLSGGNVVNIWCCALLLTNNTDTIVVSADVESWKLFPLREKCNGLFKQVVAAVKKDTWGRCKFDLCRIEMLKREDQERGRSMMKTGVTALNL